MPYKLVISQVLVTKTSNELKQKYQAAKGKVLSHKELVKAQCEEFKRVQMEVLENSNEVRLGLSRLKNIALKADPLSHVEYIKILIQTEKQAADPGYIQRMEQLDLILKHAQALEAISIDKYDPFKEHREALAKRPKHGAASLTPVEKILFDDTEQILKFLGLD